MFRPTLDTPGATLKLPSSGRDDRTMLIAQITDVHLGFVPGDPDEPNRIRLDRLIAALHALDRTPDMLFVTGDLVEHGDVAAYRLLRDTLDRVGLPVHLCLGNHDDRGAFRSVFPEVATDANGYVQYAVEGASLRCIVLDTLEAGRHGGGFGPRRAAWLRARLAEDPRTPTLIVLHHPPFDCGIDWITTAPDEPWVQRLRGALAGAANLVGMIAGHVHRPIMTGWAGMPCVVCPSSAPQLALTLAPLDPARPDGRVMVLDSPPALALHWWTGSALVSHFLDVATVPALARFDRRMQPAVAAMMDERPA